MLLFYMAKFFTCFFVKAMLFQFTPLASAAGTVFFLDCFMYSPASIDNGSSDAENDGE